MNVAFRAGWSGQVFAIARGGGDSPQGKKRRNRRSKEDRKSMVETFIKTYQKANDGSFPSLNLTHKEVGGSFYTVREIVREVIQENKVLRPGNPDSQALNLDDYVEVLSADEQSPLPLGVNGHHTEGDVNHEKALLFHKEIEQSDSGIYEIDETNFQELIAAQSNEIVDAELSDGISLVGVEQDSYSNNDTFGAEQSQDGKNKFEVGEHAKVVDWQLDSVSLTEDDIPEITLADSPEYPIAVENNNVSLSEKMEAHSSVQEFSISSSSVSSEHPIAVKDPIALENNEVTLSGKTEAHSYVEEPSISSSSSDSSKHPIAVEKNEVILSEKIEVHSSSIEDFSISSSSSDGSSIQTSPGVEDFQGFREAVKINNHANKKNLKTEQLQYHATGTATNLVADMSPVSDVSNQLASETPTTKVEPVLPLQVHTEKDSQTIEKGSGQVNSHHMKLEQEAVTELEQHILTTQTESKSSDSPSSKSVEGARKDQKTPETDPFWSAIKGFFAAFVKFWTE